jgi:hypothetical protein
MTTNRQDPDALLTREQTAAALTACGFPNALNSGIARGRSAVSIVRATCPLSLGGSVEMGASASQHATSIDFGRRCVACAATPRQPSKKGGHIQRRNSMSVADMPLRRHELRCLSTRQDNEGNDHAGPNAV